VIISHFVLVLERKNMRKKRLSGVLLPVASLPAKDIGNFGKVAYEFLDQLVASGQKIWQMLPIGPTIIHDSPFYSPSAFAISPNYIALEDLTENPTRKVLEAKTLEDYYHKFDFENPNRVAYHLLWEQKRPILQQAYRTFLSNVQDKTSFQRFVASQAFWLEDYAKFMGVKELFMGQKAHETWFQWPPEFKNKTEFDRLYCEFEKIVEQNQHKDDVNQWNFNASGYWNRERVTQFHTIHYQAGYHRFLQWIVFEQWQQLKQAAQLKGIILIGDCPIYVAPDSADVWANQAVFKLTASGNQACYAGVPPDYFSPKYGQFWGNPIYKWFVNEERQELNMAALNWWCNRLQHQFSLFDELRIDHFRGFAGYWEIPADKCTEKDENGVMVKTAKYGAWKPAAGIRLFEYVAERLHKKLTELPIIAEDLGVITKDVTAIREALQAPGMAIFQFAAWDNLHYIHPDGTDQYLKTDADVRGLPLHEQAAWDRLFYMVKDELVPFSQHEFLPENAPVSGKRISYPGTHDNETLVGWFTSKDRLPAEKAIFERYLDHNLRGEYKQEPIHWKVIRLLLKAPELQYTIFQMQDLLGLPNIGPQDNIKIRTNIPNKEGQWQWKLGGTQQFSMDIMQKLKEATRIGGRS